MLGVKEATGAGKGAAEGGAGRLWFASWQPRPLGTAVAETMSAEGARSREGGGAGLLVPALRCLVGVHPGAVGGPGAVPATGGVETTYLAAGPSPKHNRTAPTFSSHGHSSPWELALAGGAEGCPAGPAQLAHPEAGVWSRPPRFVARGRGTGTF